jgi:hypothetical protein
MSTIKFKQPTERTVKVICPKVSQSFVQALLDAGMPRAPELASDLQQGKS